MFGVGSSGGKMSIGDLGVVTGDLVEELRCGKERSESCLEIWSRW